MGYESIIRLPHLVSALTEKVRDIPGWDKDPKNYTNFHGKSKKTSAEAHLLYRLAKETGAGNKADVGVLYGHSTAVIAHGIQDSGETSNIYAVDLFGNLGENLHLIPSRLENYVQEQNLDKVQLYICKGDSSSWGWKLVAPFNFVFIDADHSEEGFRKDFLAWSRLIEKGGYLACHDCHMSTIDQVLREEIDPEKWEQTHYIFTTKAFRRK
jgi:predicted O-methyltransferase YrrM